MNWGHLSETISWGMPWSLKTQVTKLAVYKAVFGKGDKMNHLGEPIHDGQYGVVTFRRGESANKILGNMGPGA